MESPKAETTTGVGVKYLEVDNDFAAPSVSSSWEDEELGLLTKPKPRRRCAQAAWGTFGTALLALVVGMLGLAALQDTRQHPGYHLPVLRDMVSPDGTIPAQLESVCIPTTAWQGELPPRPVTVPFNESLKLGSDALPLDDPRLTPRVTGKQPEQIHLTYLGPDSLMASWVTEKAQLAAEAEGRAQVYSQLYDTPGWLNYTSGIIHHAELKGLRPRRQYFYRCGDPTAPDQWSEELSFTMLPGVGGDTFPLRLGLIGDLGQTYNSSATVEHLAANSPPAVILIGDLTYADDHDFNDGFIFKADPPWAGGPISYQPRWDAWGRLMQPLLSRVPLIPCNGNHEIEMQLGGATQVSYTARQPVPHVESGSASPLYYSTKIGPVHITMLSSYTGYHRGSPQYEWLAADLAAVDRSVTPWLLVGFHAPWYNTVAAHFKENECMRLEMEPLLYDAGADIVVSGHVHSYERINSVYNYTLDRCGPVYLNIGDGGNIEALYRHWVDEPGLCPSVPQQGPSYQPEVCPTYQDGHYCPQEQPLWSAYRDPSYGHGVLDFVNSTHALWQWNRNQDGMQQAADTVYIVRKEASCAHHRG